MMASHRPADSSPPPPHEPTSDPTATSSGTTTLPESSFLAGFDWLLAMGVLALAFLIASFAVRNSDFWMHLATGRLIADGKYEFGKDPFSYVGADRIWVNHAWLFDWMVYLLYKAAAAPGVVVGKAIVLTLTAGLLLLARKPGQSVFAGVVCTGLALVAAAPRLLLQPTIITFLFLAGLMFLLVRSPKRAGTWGFPIAIGGLFALWANCDQWFFIGPLFLLLYTVGQYVRPDDGLNVGTLWKALGIGVVACMLNPHHVRVWTFPPELWDGHIKELFAQDEELSYLVRSGLVEDAWNFTANAMNPTALLLLLTLSLIGFVVNRRHLSVGLVLVWAGAVGLAAFHQRAIPFLVFVTAPVAAVNLSAAGRRLAETPMAEGTVRTVHALRSGGRAATALIGLLLIALTYAGWLHPFAAQQRWKWDFEPSQSMVRAAEQIQKWHDDGTLPSEARMLNLQPDFANYVTWFAPSEKTYFDTRFRFHAEDTEEYLAVRRYLAPRLPRERQQDPYDLGGFLRKHNITYAVTAHSSRRWNQAALGALWGGEDPAASPEWVLWHVEGKAVVLGWTKQESISPSAFDKLRFDPLKSAYVDVQPLATPAIRPPLPLRDVWERFVTAPAPAPAEGEEALVLMQYRQSLINRAAIRHQATLLAVHIACKRFGPTSPAYLWSMILPQVLRPKMPPEVSAVALLAVRAARKAVASSPDHPDGYFYLAEAYTDPTLFSFPDVQEFVITVNLSRCRARISEDPTQRRTSIDVIKMCSQLDQAHRTAVPPRLDLLFDVTLLGLKYLEDEIDVWETNLDRLSGDIREQLAKEIDARRKDLAEQKKKVELGEADLRKSTDKYVNQAAGLSSPLDRAALARQYGLVREAIAELHKAHEQFQKQLDNESEKKQFAPVDLALQFAIHAELIELMMYDGRVEEASRILDSVDTQESVDVMRTDAVRAEYAKARRKALYIVNPRNPPVSQYDDNPAAHFRTLRQAVALATGDFERATEVMARDVKTIRTDYANFRALNFPIGPLPQSMTLPPSRGLVDLVDQTLDLCGRPLQSPLNPVGAQLAGLARLIHIGKVQQMLNLSEARVEAHVRLALTYLEQGDMPSAVHHFRESLDAPEFRMPLPTQLIAKEHLRNIARVRGGPGAGP
jgi:tetratricopeptide (TPR) repeat protein